MSAPTSALQGMPPGRAGLLWLRHRLDLARRAADRLDQKLRVLRNEQAAVVQQLRRTGPAWEQACREAQGWLDRALLLGGDAALRPPGRAPLAEVGLAWATVMGVRYPAGADCVFPAPDAGEAALPTAASVQARDSCRRALAAAARHAAVLRAAAELDGEVARTRLRLRGIEQRWVPRLEAALAAARTTLDEDEHAEGTRLRWAREVTEARR